jgi:hypothetical protein
MSLMPCGLRPTGTASMTPNQLRLEFSQLFTGHRRRAFSGDWTATQRVRGA